MSPEQALAFLAFAAVAAITPGPSNVMLTVTGAVAGILRGLPCLLGVGTGMALMMFVVAFGLGALLLRHETLVHLLRWCGAAFLLWLAWKIATAPHGDGPEGGRPVGFLGALAGVLIQAFCIAGLFFAVALACGFVWLAFGVAVRRVLKPPGLRRIFNLAMGGLLAASVVLFVW